MKPPSVNKTSKKHYIICVDDEVFMLESLVAQLKQRFGDKYNYEIAESGEEALSLIKDIYDAGNEVALVITDQLMPNLAGDQLLIEIHKLYPHTIKLLLTGQATLESAINAINNANLFSYLKKPWDENSLLLAVEKGLTQYRLLEKLENQITTFRKFVPQEFLRLLSIKDSINEPLSIEPELAQELDLTIIFCDIIGYTKLSETLVPKSIFHLLNRFFGKINPIIEHHNGFIDKFLGDGIIALFSGNSDEALTAGIEILAAVKDLNKELIEEESLPIEVGIGINFGKVILGTVGTAERIDDTVIGDTVNLASRTQSLNRIYGTHLLITESAFANLSKKAEYKMRFIDKVKVKGRLGITKLYEVFLAGDSDARVYDADLLAIYDKAVSLYQNKSFFEADQLFTKCLAKFPNDQLFILYSQRCENFMENGCPPDWDGTTIHIEK